MRTLPPALHRSPLSLPEDLLSRHPSPDQRREGIRGIGRAASPAVEQAEIAKKVSMTCPCGSSPGGKNWSSQHPSVQLAAASPNAMPAAPANVANSTGLYPLAVPTNAVLDRPRIRGRSTTIAERTSPSLRRWSAGILHLLKPAPPAHHVNYTGFTSPSAACLPWGRSPAPAP